MRIRKISSKKPIGCAVVGCGYWGQNLIRNAQGSHFATLLWCLDLDIEKAKKFQQSYPNINISSSLDDALNDPAVDLVMIATPVAAHYEIALRALQANKHVLVEKPITDSSAMAKHLIDEAESRGLHLFVDHTFLFTGAVRKIREFVETGYLGNCYYYDSERVNLGLFQHDVNVIWDLAVHDLSIMDYVFGRKPISVSATGMSHIPEHSEDMAYMTLFYDDSFIAHLNVNWLAPVKLRRTIVGGQKRMLVYDDLPPDEKIKVYEKGVELTSDPTQIMQMLVGYRTGDAFIPKLDNTEALAVEIEHICACIQGEEEPICDGRAGLRVVNILEAATESLANRGQPVDICY